VKLEAQVMGYTLSAQAPWDASLRRVWRLERTAGTEDGHEDDAPADIPPAGETHGHGLTDGHARLHRRHRQAMSCHLTRQLRRTGT
jgi:hypothetical protein